MFVEGHGCKRGFNYDFVVGFMIIYLDRGCISTNNTLVRILPAT